MKNIVFDVDGTLINTGNCVKNVYRQLILDELGKTVSEEEIAKGRIWPTLKALEVYGFTNIPDAYAKYHANLMVGYQSVHMYEGMAETLKILKERNIRLSVVTARNRSELVDDVIFQRFAHYFDFLITADDTTKFKPEPDPLLLFLKKSNAKANETIYIGDAYTDFLCAKNAGIDFGLALWGAETRNGIDAEYYFSHPSEIPGILDCEAAL